MTIEEKLKQREAAERERQAFISAIRKKQERIKELRYNLKQIDYKTNKYVEGELSEEEWAEVKAQRKAWRDEFNALQAEIKALASTT